MKALIFVNGFRKRFTEETGGLNKLSNLFDYFIDTSTYMKPWEHERKFDDNLNHKKYISVSNEKELNIILKEKRIAYVLFVGLEWSKRRYSTLKIMKQAGVEWGILFIRGDQRALFNGGKYDPDRKKIISTCRKIKEKINLTRYKILSFNLTPKHYLSNDVNAFNFPEVKHSTNNKLINHKDYYLSQAFEKPEVAEEYAVFLDQAYPFHFKIDHNINNKTRYYDNKRCARYYSHLNNYLNTISKLTGLQIVICLHPNCPDNYKDYFSDGFKIVKYQTGKYARYANLLITHNSTSISMAYMYNLKAVMLILTEAMPDSKIKSIQFKAETENITLHKWPSKNFDIGEISIPKNKKVKNFYIPNPSSTSLIDEIKEIL